MRAQHLVWFLAGWMVSAAGVTSAAPTVDAVLEKWVEASGGKAALERLLTRTAAGTLQISALGVKGDVVFKAKAPDRRLTQVTLPGLGAVKEGFDGRVAWTQNPGMPVTDKSGKELARARREAVFHRELKFKEVYPRREMLGAGKVGEREVWIILAATADGDVEKFYFDAREGLLVKQEASVDTPVGRVDTEVLFEDYREVDGLRIPTTVRMVQPQEMAFTLTFSEVRHNEPIADVEFKRPQ